MKAETIAGTGLRGAAVLALGLGLSSCGGTTSVAQVQAASLDTDVVPHSREADDVAHFIAGLPSRAGSPFAEAENSEEWKDHRRLLDQSWKRAEAGFIAGLRSFGESTVQQGSGAARPLFYPFGGPDALTAVLCFPQSPAYILAGLEPPGTLPTSAQLDRKNLPLFLGAIRESMASELGRSFFVTREMDHRFRGQLTDGLMLPILFLLARTDHEILGLRPVRVDEEGRVVALPADGAVGAKFRNRGVEIEFQGKGAPQRLYYFTVNLNDKRLGANTGFQTYVTQLGTVKTLLKATSYMTHRPEFSVIRNRILAQSEAILQDDSGIPYKFFDPAVWQVRLFGEYERPYGSFRWLEQPTLRQAYQAPGVEPLPFHIGYGFSRIPSNLLLARRSNTAARARN
ncbi:MAG TPA: hypothetical protein VGR73_11650 [Bryobacteraceae bacterium]|nr:hypothetical protein [Bryobacteraceae bacterium]